MKNPDDSWGKDGGTEGFAALNAALSPDLLVNRPPEPLLAIGQTLFVDILDSILSTSSREGYYPTHPTVAGSAIPRTS